MKLSTLLMIIALLSFTACTKEESAVIDDNNEQETGIVTIVDDGTGTGTTTWSSDKTYILDGFVFVNEGQTLTIEAGTVIKGKPGEAEEASALVVARGAKIIAEGTAEKPIIFTAEADQLTGNISLDQRGLWGGLIILGKAKLNTTPSEQAVEGLPTTEVRGIFGGADNNDNSGILKYVSIRHGGTNIGAENEINGLSLGAVGSQTTLEYIEVIANKDDGIEFFGGVPNLKYCLVSNCADDCYDYDMGFSGKGQFWVAIQSDAAGDRIGEHDGGTTPETASPFAIPTISNVTYIGRGNDAAVGKRLITFRDNAGGKYFNSIFMSQASGIDIENLADDQDSYKQFQDGNLKIENNIFWDITTNSQNATGTDLFTVSEGADDGAMNFSAYFATAGNEVLNPNISKTNPVPASAVGSSTVTDLSADSFFDIVTYKGAFEPAADNWAAGWTRYFENK